MLSLSELMFEVFHTIIYVVLWLVLFLGAVLLVEKYSKWSLHKELIEDQNVALWVMFAGFFIALAIIIAAAVHW